MKPKKQISKLSLKKETIANLKVTELKDIKAGAEATGNETYWPLSYCCSIPQITCTLINELCGLTQTSAPEPTCTMGV